MKDLLINILEDVYVIDESENNNEYNIEIKFNVDLENIKICVENILEKVNQEDYLAMNIIQNEDLLIDGEIIYNLHKYSIEDIDKFFKDELDDFEDGKAILNIKINKNTSEYKTIYSLEKWLFYFESLNLKNKLNFFGRDKCLKYFLINTPEIKLLETKKIMFSSNKDEILNFSPSINENGYNRAFYNVRSRNKLYILPDDFKFLINKNLNEIKEIFDNLKSLLSLMFVSSSFDIIQNEVEIIVDGFKHCKKQINIPNDKLKESEYYKIYEWAYNGGNLVDKLGIIKNVLSKNNPFDFSSINRDVFLSISGNHNLYLKDNIQKYFDTKNKIADDLFSLNEKMHGIINDFTDELKKNIIYIFSFFISIVVLGVIGNGEFEEIFKGNIVVISWVVIIASIVYCCYINYESGRKIKKYIKDYFRFKNGYKDIFERHDLNKIFNNNSELKSNIKFFKKERNITNITFGSIAILLMLLLYYMSKPSDDLKIPLSKIDGKVIKTQILLNEVGYKLKIDGILGTETKTGIQEYQKEKKMEINGKVTEILINNLLKITCRKNEPHETYNDNE